MSLLAALFACSSTKTTSNVQPFHVGVIPFGTERAPSQAPIEGRVARFELQLDGEQLSQTFAAEMDGFTFTEVTHLSYPEGVSAAEFQAWALADREAHWIEAARDRGVDLILKGKLRFNPVTHTSLRRSLNGHVLRIGTNAAGILLAARSKFPYLLVLTTAIEVGSWGTDDSVYSYEVSLSGELHDASALGDPASGATLANRQAELSRITTFESESTMGFLTRARPFDYVVSILIPSALLSGSAVREQKALREDIVENALIHWIQQFGLNRNDLLACPDLVPFEVRDMALVPAAPPEEGWVLSAGVALDTAVVDVMDGFTVRSRGEVLVEGSLVDSLGQDDSGRTLYEVRAELPGLKSGDRVRMELRDGALRQGTRTFSFIAGRTGSLQRKPIRLDLDVPQEQLPEGDFPPQPQP